MTGRADLAGSRGHQAAGTWAPEGISLTLKRRVNRPECAKSPSNVIPFSFLVVLGIEPQVLSMLGKAHPLSYSPSPNKAILKLTKEFLKSSTPFQGFPSSLC